MSSQDPNFLELVGRIFSHFDSDNAGHLNQEKLLRLFKTFNQDVNFTDDQLHLIVEQMQEEYAPQGGSRGITVDALARLYQDGQSDVKADLHTLGLDEAPLNRQISMASVDKALQEYEQDHEQDHEQSLQEAGAIDFEPETQADAFALISEAKPVPAPLDAQSDTAQSIGPRIGSVLAETPKARTDDFGLSALENSLGIRRAQSGAESIADLAGDSLKIGHSEDLPFEPTKQHNASAPPTSLPIQIPGPLSLKLNLPVPDDIRRSQTSPNSPLSARLRSPKGPHVAEMVSKFEEAASPRAMPSPGSWKPAAEERKGFSSPRTASLPSNSNVLQPELLKAYDLSQLSPGEKRKKILSEASPRPHKLPKEEAAESVSAAATAKPQRKLDVSRNIFVRPAKPIDFQTQLQSSVDTWVKTKPAWSDMQIPTNTALIQNTALAEFDPGPDQRLNLANAKTGLNLDPDASLKFAAQPASGPGGKSDLLPGHKQQRLYHILSTDSRASNQSTIQAHVQARRESTEDERDDVFDEYLGPTGEVLKFPSAISIEDRQHLSLRRGSSSAHHSRMTSGASEAMEASNRPDLHIEVPLEVNRIIEGVQACNLSPGSTSVAEKEAQVGYESLDSQDFASFSHSPSSPSRPGFQAGENQVVLLRSELQSLVQIKASSKLIGSFQNKIESRCSKSEAFDLHMELGRLLSKRGSNKDAMRSFRSATDICNDSTQAHLRLGNCLFALDSLLEAETAFKMALQVAKPGEKNDLLMRVHTNLGITLEAMGMLVAATTHYRNASELVPNHARAFKLLGGAHYALGNLELAKFELEKAISLDPKFADAYCDLGCCLCAMGAIDEAKATFKTALQHNNRHVEACFNLGNLERQTGEFKAALKCYTWVLHLEPKHWRALLNSAVAFVSLKRPIEAQAALQRALKLTGNHKAIADEIKYVDSLSQKGASLADLNETATAIASKMIDVPSPVKAALQGQRRETFSELVRKDSEEIVNHQLLKRLSPFCSVSTSKLHAKIQAQSKVNVLNQAEVESIARSLLQHLRPRTFTTFMSCLLQHVLPKLEHVSQQTSTPGWVDQALVWGVLIVLSQGSWQEKLEALRDALSEDQKTVTVQNAAAFVDGLQAIFLVEQQQPRENVVNQKQALKTMDALDMYLMSSTSGLPIMAKLNLFASQAHDNSAESLH